MNLRGSTDGAVRRGFTLIELLVVVAIIALLISILLPSLGKARERGRIAQCLSNVRQIGLSYQTYMSDFNGHGLAVNSSFYGQFWIVVLEQYHSKTSGSTNSFDDKLYYCPSANQLSTLASAFGTNTTAWNGNLNRGAWLKVVVPESIGQGVELPGQTNNPYLYLGPGGQPLPSNVVAGLATGETRSGFVGYGGSYGINSWLYSADLKSGAYTLPADYTQPMATMAQVQIPSSTPLFFDCTWPDTEVSVAKPGVMPTDGTQGNMQGTTTSSGTSRVFLNRHNKGINIAFLDGHAELTSLTDIWHVAWYNGMTRKDIVLPAN